MKQLWLPGKHVGLNELLEAKGNVGAGQRWNGYSELKKIWAREVSLRALHQKFECREGGSFTYLFVERDKRRDPWNIYAPIKLIEDGLVDAGLLGNDGWNHVKQITPYHTLRVSGELGVLLVVSLANFVAPTKEEMNGILQGNAFRKL